MNRYQILKQMLAVYREGKYLGDLATLRAALNLGQFRPTPMTHQFLKGCSEIPDFSQVDLETLGPATLGAAYGRFLKRYHLKPFRFSGRFHHLAMKHQLVVRYASLHDMFHVLTGYDTSLAGEAGVWGFVAGQNFSMDGQRAASLTQILYPIVNPTKSRLIRQAYQEGLENGAKAQSLIEVDFMKHLSSDLQEVRRQLRVTPTKLFQADI